MVHDHSTDKERDDTRDFKVLCDDPREVGQDEDLHGLECDGKVVLFFSCRELMDDKDRKTDEKSKESVLMEQQQKTRVGKR